MKHKLSLFPDGVRNIEMRHLARIGNSKSKENVKFESRESDMDGISHLIRFGLTSQKV